MQDLVIQPAAFQKQVLDWFEVHGRKDLPWQKKQTAYRVWVSEIMLQQTQVRTVIPYYKKFMQSFPDIITLAEADEDTLMSHWSGLGYYSRARNLHKAAKIIVGCSSDKKSSDLPTTYEELIELPGIGRSTAGAILALAYETKAAILDGNVKRVLARYFTVDGWPGKAAVLNRLWSISESLTPSEAVRNYTQAMMDLGATVCRASKPLCVECPLNSGCLAYKYSSQIEYPGKKPKKKLPVKEMYFFIILSNNGQVVMEKRPPTGIWGGLWAPPCCDIKDDKIQFLKKSLGIQFTDFTALESFRHTFSHYHLQIHPLLFKHKNSRQIKEMNTKLRTKADWLNSGVPAAVKKMLMQIPLSPDDQ